MNLLRRLERSFITASHARPSQIVHRVRKLLRQKFIHNSTRYQNWLRTLYTGEEPVQTLSFPMLHTHPVNAQAIADGQFTFLNRTYSLGKPVDWSPSTPSTLWTYNLHYFEYSVSLAKLATGEDQNAGDQTAFDVLCDLLLDWMNANQRTIGLAWHAYPVSLRICNWIKVYSLLGDRLSQVPDLARSLRRSIAMQTRYLEDNLEYDLMNNHLLENGRALLNAGLFFQHSDAARWQKKGHDILMLGLREHFLEDGAHDELSPMYHQIVLDMYIEMRKLLEQRRLPIPDLLNTRIERGLRWLEATVHPDGKIALLNDAAHGIAPEPSHFLGNSKADYQSEFEVFEDSQLACFRDRERKDYLVIDNGPLGPDRIPGHGHCDSLSFELSLAGNRMIVDSGVEHYHEDETWRNYYRGTRAHNTVVVDGQEQSEIWGSFRVARRAKPLHTFHGQTADQQLCYWSSAHSGYHRLPGKVTHRRWICWVQRRFWLVVDCVSGTGEHELESLIHFHPEAEVAESFDEPIRRNNAALRIVPLGCDWTETLRGESDPPQGWYAPEFGQRIANTVWKMTTTAELPVWFGYVLWPSEQRVEAMLSSSNAMLSPGKDNDCHVRIEAERTWEVHFNTADSDVSLVVDPIPSDEP